jgi:DNA-binding FadR family transcriptional regulator
VTTTPDASGELVRSLVERTVFTPVRAGSAVAETVERLGRAIGMGLLRPGDRLPPESRLADDLGISPVTLRNALSILRGAGLLLTQRGRGGGTFVAERPPAHPAAGTLPTRTELHALADYRTVIEGGAAELAAERATAEQIGHLERLAADMEAEPDYDAWGELDTLLHLVVADASGCPHLVNRVAETRAEVHRIATLGTVPRQTVELADREHRSVVHAIRARRPHRARLAMIQHVESTRALWLGLGRAAIDRGGT